MNAIMAAHQALAFATPIDHRHVFCGAPLITPERLQGDWQAAFPAVPAWAARVLGFTDGRIGVIVSGVQRRGIFMSCSAFACLVEITRWGGSVTTKSMPTPYGHHEASLVLAMPEGETVPLRGFISGAVEVDGQPSWVACDYSPDNDAYPANPRARDAARAVALSAANRLAGVYAERQFAKRWGFNLGRLFAHLDGIAPT